MDDVYALYRRGLALLDEGHAHAAAIPLERAVVAEPQKGSLRESLGRAYYAAKRYSAALEQFDCALDVNPADDYAHLGAGLCLERLGRLDEAVGHLRIASAMRPGVDDYGRVLRRLEARRASVA